MIRVECGACGAGFQARDELAGRSGRCPRCKVAIVVPPAPASASAPPASRPAATGPAPAGVRSRGARGRSGGASRGRRSSGFDTSVLVRILALIAVIATAVYFVAKGGGLEPQSLLVQAEYALDRGDPAAAIALLEQVPAGDPAHARAREMLEQAGAQATITKGRSQSFAADAQWTVIDAIKRGHVDGLGPEAPLRQRNCRYLLKRAAEFVTLYPDHPKAAEAADMPRYYALVASLERPPDVEDVRAELSFRVQAKQYGEAVAAVEEFRAVSPANAEAADTFLEALRESALDSWKSLKSRLTADGALASGSEDWKRVFEQTRRYLDQVEGLHGVSGEAGALHERARVRLAAKGG